MHRLLFAALLIALPAHAGIPTEDLLQHLDATDRHHLARALDEHAGPMLPVLPCLLRHTPAGGSGGMPTEDYLKLIDEMTVLEYAHLVKVVADHYTLDLGSCRPVSPEPAPEPELPAVQARVSSVDKATCKGGGTRFEAGLDADANGVLDDAEVAVTELACKGEKR